jgi:threonylcarbamoyladenosine tRNA methylthiotransferase MtaB
MFGFTENYIKVKTQYDPMLVNEITEFTLTAIDEEMVMKGRIAAPVMVV